MSGAREGGYAKIARCAMSALGLVLTLSSHALAESAAEGEVSPSDIDPTQAPSMPTTSPPRPEEPPPTEFPGVVQGGVVTAPRPAFARPWATQRNFALVATEGSYNGFGLGVRGGSLRIGLEGSFAFLPLLATYSPDPETFPE